MRGYINTGYRSFLISTIINDVVLYIRDVFSLRYVIRHMCYTPCSVLFTIYVYDESTSNKMRIKIMLRHKVGNKTPLEDILLIELYFHQ